MDEDEFSDGIGALWGGDDMGSGTTVSSVIYSNPSPHTPTHSLDTSPIFLSSEIFLFIIRGKTRAKFIYY